MNAQYFQWMARYNQWANTTLLAAMEARDPADYMADRGLFFGSLHGTLCHVLVGDILWMDRVTGESRGSFALDDRPWPDLPALRAARIAEDAHIIARMDRLDDGDLAADLSYRNLAGAAFTQPLWQVLAHLFNHQAHHRGQAHAAMTRAGWAAPELDIIFFARRP